MKNSHIVIAAQLIAACGLAGPKAAAEPPPETLRVHHGSITSKLGYVTFLGYFSEEEVNDPLWEFARIQRAGVNWCRSESRFKRRDVRWFNTTPADGKRCAALIYTVECLEPREEITERVNPRFHDGLEQARDTFLSGPPHFPLGPSCSSRDAK